MSLIWSDPESRERRKPLAECPLFESGLSCTTSLAAQCETGVQQIKAGSPPAAPDIAHARRTDPVHSHEAAKSVVNLGRTRDAILHILKAIGPATDQQIADYYEQYIYDPVSTSGLRTRRSELVRMGFVIEGGTGKTATGRKCTIWRLA